MLNALTFSFFVVETMLLVTMEKDSSVSQTRLTRSTYVSITYHHIIWFCFTFIFSDKFIEISCIFTDG